MKETEIFQRTTGPSQQLQARFYFRKTFPGYGISLYFLKFFRFGGSIPPVRFW
nr:MAG TPA: hypothetical protein [Caudoviricetes sp.]